jgi:hypothetical protein
MSKILTIVFVIIIIGYAYLIGGKYLPRSYTKECGFELPHQYFLVQDTLTKRYAIKFMHIDVYPYFMYVRRYSTIPDSYSNMGDASEAETFKDSCEAKGFAKRCFEKMAEKEKEKITPNRFQ